MTDKKIIMLKSGKKYTAVDGQDYHCSFGVIKKEDIEKGFGKTNTDVSFNIFEPTFIDVYEKIKRLAQIIPLKDIGTIIANTGINKNSIVIESGSGSGGLTCVLANVCKKVYSYDIKKAHLDISQKNIKKLGFDNVKFNLQNIEEDFVLDDNELADLAVLDLPQPWNAIDSTVKNLKKGAFLVTYSPCITQVEETVNKIVEHKNLIYYKTVEIIEREWHVKGKKIRPISNALTHSAFLTFSRVV